MNKEERVIIKVDEKNVNIRLDRFLIAQNLCADDEQVFSRGAISRGIVQGSIRVNGQKVKPHYSVSVLDTITIAQEFFVVRTKLISDENVNFEILFESESFIVIDKPAGLIVHPVSFNASVPTLVHGLIARYPEIVQVGDDVLRPGIVHRLDRETSGVMVVARTQEAFVLLKKAFQNHLVQKRYYTIVYGRPKEERCVIDFPIARSVRGDRWRALRTQRDPSKGTIRTAQTAYTLQCSNDTMSVICAQPRTGRTHQIRVHLHAIGCPLVGDSLYKHKDCISNSMTRHALHAVMLRFVYDGHVYVYTSPLPQDMQILSDSICRNAHK